MRCTPSPRVLLLAAFYLFFSLAASAQDKGHHANSWLGRLLHKSQSVVSPLGCENDQTAPVIHCPTGNCLSNARAAYLKSYAGEPWGQPQNLIAMNAVFGSNWDGLHFEDADVASLLSPAYKVLFLEGSDGGGYALDAFLSANLPALENWVAAGGALFINCAANNAPSGINYGFGGVTLQPFVYGYDGVVQVPEHPVFTGPFQPANGNFSGPPFSYGAISGAYGQVLLTDLSGTIISLTDKPWGAGKVYFGAMILPYWLSPQPNVQNMWQNILADLNTVCNGGIRLPADQGNCMATVADQALDATATDDCTLASLTHDFAAAQVNTSLLGATFSTTATLIRWTATDAAGNTGTCEFLVSAQEPEAPVITCPDNFTVNADPGVCGAAAIFTITATDNCSATPTITSTPAAGSTLPNGITVVQAFATDESYNTASCSFAVTVLANPEICNGLDDDCNGLVDDGAPADNTFYLDADGDGYGDLTHPIAACQPPPYYVANSLDCNDANYYIQPGMYESCNELDDNCDGQIDEGVAPTWFADADGDGYGNPLVTLLACSQPLGYVPYNGDCDDTNAYIHVGAQEDCTNLEDENCDGILGDNNFSITETHTDVYCGSTPDGSISITVAPNQNYTLVLWSNNVCCTTTQSNLVPGTYKVTVTNECGTTKTKSIEILPSPTPTLLVDMTGTDVSCYGDGNGSVTATPRQGCGTYTYLWNTGSTDATLTGLSGGFYSVVVTDACGCTQTGTFTVNEASYPLSLNFGAIIALLDGTYWVQVLPYGGTGPYKFRRSILPSGTTPWVNGNGFADLLPGSYTFEVQDKNGCTAQVMIDLAPFSPRPGINPEGLPDFAVPEMTTDDLPASETDNRTQPAAASPTTGDWAVSVFPNPADAILHIEWTGLDGKSAAIEIVNQMGQVLRSLPVPEDALRVMANIGDLPGGIYFVKIVANGREMKVVRFVKA